MVKNKIDYMDIKTLKEEHVKVSELMVKIKDKINNLGYNLSIDEAKSLRIYLFELFGLLKVHIEKEDHLLYPELLRSLDPLLREAAASIMEENKKITQLMQTIECKSSVLEIYNLPKKFCTEFNDFADKLFDRIKNEELVLFRFVDINKVEYS
jgi:hemerythrin-like domain-containing protein